MKGTLIVGVIEAVLTRNTELIGKMDPYLILKLKEYESRTAVKDSAGKTPKWNEIFCFRTQENNTVKFEIWDYEAIKKDDFVGEGEFSISGIRKKKSFWFPVYYKNNNIGNIMFELEFVPKIEEEIIVKKVFTFNFFKFFILIWAFVI